MGRWDLKDQECLSSLAACFTSFCLLFGVVWRGGTACCDMESEQSILLPLRRSRYSAQVSHLSVKRKVSRHTEPLICMSALTACGEMTQMQRKHHNCFLSAANQSVNRWKPERNRWWENTGAVGENAKGKNQSEGHNKRVFKKVLRQIKRDFSLVNSQPITSYRDDFVFCACVWVCVWGVHLSSIISCFLFLSDQSVGSQPQNGGSVIDHQ